MTITKGIYNGSWVISDMIRGFLTTRVYYYYTKKEAVKDFKGYFRKKVER